MRGKRRRDELELLDDRQKLSAIALKNPGASSTQLALLFQEQHGKSIPARTIRYDLQALKKQLVAESQQNIELLRVVEFQRLDQLEQETWDAWRKSQLPKQKEIVERLSQQIASNARAELAGSLARELADANKYVTEEVLETIIANAIEASVSDGEDEDTFIHKITQITEGTVGNPQLLALIHKIQQDRRKLQGVYAPELHAIQVQQKIEVKGYKGGWSPDDCSELERYFQ
jgi:hypothetical protein